MAKEPPEVSEFDPENSEKHMSVVCEASALMMEIAGEPRAPVKEAIYRSWREMNSALRQLGYQPVKLSRAEDIWRAEARRIDAEEIRALELARVEAERKREDEKTARLVASLSRQRAAMLSLDPEGHREEAEALRRAVAALGRHRRPDAVTAPASDEGGE
jgi:hypothetical protein